MTTTTSGNNTAGETYSLECSVNGGHSAQFQWFNESETDVTGQESTAFTSSPSSSILEFSPLHQSHGGTYTCSVNVSGTVVSKSVELSVKGSACCLHGLFRCFRYYNAYYDMSLQQLLQSQYRLLVERLLQT